MSLFVFLLAVVYCRVPCSRAPYTGAQLDALLARVTDGYLTLWQIRWLLAAGFCDLRTLETLSSLQIAALDGHTISL